MQQTLSYCGNYNILKTNRKRKINVCQYFLKRAIFKQRVFCTSVWLSLLCKYRTDALMITEGFSSEILKINIRNMQSLFVSWAN